MFSAVNCQQNNAETETVPIKNLVNIPLINYIEADSSLILRKAWFDCLNETIESQKCY